MPPVTPGQPTAIDSMTRPSGQAIPRGAQPSSDPKPGTTVKLTRLRRIIAQRMNDSLSVSAQLTTVHEVDVTRLGALRGRVKDDFQARHAVKLTYLAFLGLPRLQLTRRVSC